MRRVLTLRDGREAVLRDAEPADAEGLVRLDQALAEDGRGMVLTVDQVRSPVEQRAEVERIRREATLGSATRLAVAAIGDRIVGSATLRQLRPTLCRHVGVVSLGVHPRFQRAGVGRALMRALIAHARQAGLERLELYVRSDNRRARALYASLGFAEEGVRRRFVRRADGSYADDLIMAAFLDSRGDAHASR
ncbi:MAG: GNAT family N-acetyltransferase [Sandaracinaceae bacterium]